MFSPGVTSHSQSLRPKRTRPAVAADDSFKLPQAKRKRSALQRDTFEPLADATINEIAGRNNGAEGLNGHIDLSEQQPSPFPLQSKDLALRGAKKPEKRSERNSGTLTLSSNDFYTVAQLPALPDQIRSRPAVPYSCTISPESGYALALTHTDALIWSYNSSTTSPSSRDLFSFKLPFPPASALDPLPLAAFSAKSAGGEPGIVAVSPKSGKIVYWETITNASSFVPGQTSSGVQGSVPGMLNGETIQEIVNAEPAGFILTFSHGRVAHLTIRDQMGRPGVGVQFLRKPPTSAAGTFFGSIRHVFGADRRRGTPFAKAGKSSKGQRDVVIGSEDCDLELWNTNLGVGNSLIRTLNIREEVSIALQHDHSEPTTKDFHLSLLDFELNVNSGPSQDLTRYGDSDSTPVILLVGLSRRSGTTYYIVEAVLLGTSCLVKVVHPIKCYSSSPSELETARPKLHVQRASQLAFVFFQCSIVMYSLARVKESPSSQLLLEKQALPDPFQDCIRFQEDTIFRVLGLAMEESDRADLQSSCVFAVQGFGMVRITTTIKHQEDDDDDELNLRISPKTKIEQAVFFGTLRQNPLDLTSSSLGEAFSPDEIASAALEISTEILSSSSKYLPKTTPSIDLQMRLRAKALDDLAHYLIKHYPSSLSPATRFQLLWNAEKLAAAQSVWKVQEEIQRHYHDLKDRESTYLQFVLRALHETRQTYPEPAKGENDRVRHWLIHDPARIDHLLSEIVSCIEELPPMFVTDPRVVADWLREGEDIWIAAYETAFKFREDNAQTHGLGDEIIKDGVLQGSYPEELPQVWTSDTEPFSFATHFIFDICKFLEEWWDFNPAKNRKKKMPTNEEGVPYEAPSKKAMLELARRLPVQVELYSRILVEENLHAQSQVKREAMDSTTQSQVNANLRVVLRDRLRAAVKAISRYNMPGAIDLAEKIRDPGLLVSLNTNYLREIISESIANPKDSHRMEEQIQAIQNHAETYFDTFGNGWAFAHFTRMIQDGDVAAMLAEAQAENGKKQPYLTWYFEKCDTLGHPVGKVSWISNVIGERRYDRAEKTLEKVATNEEADIWSKRTEICLAKLAGLAATEQEVVKGRKTMQTPLASTKYDNTLALLDIQESVFEHIAPIITETIDAQAALDVSIEAFGKLVTKDKPALKHLLHQALDLVIQKHALSPVQMIDLLTLMDPVEFEGEEMNDPQVLFHEFALALRVVDVAPTIPAAQKDSLRRMIWRRAMIRDDWIVLNETSYKDDAQVETEMRMSSLFRTLVFVLQEFHNRDQSAQQSARPPKLFSPQEILEGSFYPDAVRQSLEEEEIGPVEKDLAAEQERLESFVMKGRLESHFGGLVSTAEATVRGIADEEGERAARIALRAEISGVSGIQDQDMQMTDTEGRAVVEETNGVH